MHIKARNVTKKFFYGVEIFKLLYSVLIILNQLKV